MRNIKISSWSVIRDYADNHNIPINHIEEEGFYYISCSKKEEGSPVLYYDMLKETSDSTELSDFENNYKGTFQEESLSVNVLGSTENSKVILPDSGEKIFINSFNAEGPYDNNIACQLIWDYGGDNEEIIWSIRGSGSMPFNYVIPASSTDGTKQLAITISNASLTSTHASVYISMLRI